MSNAPVLLFLFADRVVPADRAFTAGTVLPCSEAKVQSTALAATLFAAAFWDLREEGRITLAVEERKRLGLVKTTPVMARATAPVPAGGATDVPPPASATPTLQDEILARVVADSEGYRVKNLVWDWFGENVPNPNATVVGRIQADAMVAGFYDEVDAGRGMLGRLFLGATELQPRCDVIESHRAQAEAVVTRWQHFAQSEPDLAERLVKECQKSIGARTESDDSDFD